MGVVLPTYRERDSIRAVIEGFERLGVVDEIVVVNNNAEDGTSEQVAPTSAREVFEPEQGYGASMRRGLAESTTDLICTCEPDGTFDPADLLKLLPYTQDCDLVLGSRTVDTFVWSGANMDWFLRWGNWAVAKMIEALFNTNYLSDVGCTFRVISRESLERLQGSFTSTGSDFGLEMQLLALTAGLHTVQLPVNYKPRVGVSAVTGDRREAFKLGMVMMGRVARARMAAWQVELMPGGHSPARPWATVPSRRRHKRASHV